MHLTSKEARHMISFCALSTPQVFLSYCNNTVKSYSFLMGRSNIDDSGPFAEQIMYVSRQDSVTHPKGRV